MAYLRQPVGQQEGVLAGFDGLGRLEQPCSGAVVQWCSGACTWGSTLWAAAWQRWKTRKMMMSLPAAFLGQGLLLWSACFGADLGGRRAFKLDAAAGRGSSNLVNAAGS